jgi:hypothetical protein
MSAHMNGERHDRPRRRVRADADLPDGEPLLSCALGERRAGKGLYDDVMTAACEALGELDDEPLGAAPYADRVRNENAIRNGHRIHIILRGAG